MDDYFEVEYMIGTDGKLIASVNGQLALPIDPLELLINLASRVRRLEQKLGIPGLRIESDNMELSDAADDLGDDKNRDSPWE